MTITAEYAVFKHHDVNEPLEFVVSGIVQGPPHSMVELAAEAAQQYSEATDTNSAIVGVYVYEVRTIGYPFGFVSDVHRAASRNFQRSR